jgi:hypothetical protein
MKHKPTGHYYCRSRKVKLKGEDYFAYVKSNLSKKGKVYPTKPTYAWIGGSFHNHIISQELYNMGKGVKNHLHPFLESEWEIEEIG